MKKYRRAIVTLATIVTVWAAIRFTIPYPIVREANVVLSLAAALGFGLRLNDMWRHFSYGRRLIFGGIVAGLVIGAYGSAELYIQSGPPGERIYFWTVMCLTILTGLWLSRHEPHTYP